jgi:Zn-dependent protease with chaperone function
MHLIVLFAIFALAWGLRYTWAEATQATWIERWDRTLSIFLLPPLLLFTSSISIILMGPHGRMVWVGNDWLSHYLAIGFLIFAGLYLLKLTGTGWQILQQVRTYPATKLNDKRARILNLSTPYIAQIGFWQPELVITQGLLDTLGVEHLTAVLAHEQAHYRYRDTWYFFWLGWVRQITPWLPQTETMWQELLVLRELRADLWASSQTDPILVAEALLLVVQNTSVFPENFCTAFSQVTPANRLAQRLDALLGIAAETPDSVSATEQLWRGQRNHLYSWAWLLLAFLPLLAVPFHT